MGIFNFFDMWVALALIYAAFLLGKRWIQFKNAELKQKNPTP